MAVKYKHADIYSMYFCTFTCYQWIHLFKLTNSYGTVYNLFNILKQEKIEVVGYVIMPNHVHCILYFPEAGFTLSKILSSGKRFIAYEIINRLEKANDIHTLQILQAGITEREREKKQLHKVFTDSFDAKAIFSEKFLLQKLNYIHYNPVSGKWRLIKDFVSYEHSSASFYEEGFAMHFKPKHFNDL
jgi:putative transposase